MTLRTSDFIVGPSTDTLPNVGTVESSLVVTKSASYTVTDTDNVGTVIVDDTSSNRTITLPTAADNTDRKLIVINTSSDGGTVTVDGEGAETVDGGTTVVMATQYDKVEVQCDGTSWYSISSSPHQLIQDYTAIGAVGDASQQYAGHDLILNEDGATDDVAVYNFQTGALTTDESTTYDLTDHGTVTEAAGLNGGAAGSADFNGADQWFTHATLFDTTPTTIAMDFWLKADDGVIAAGVILTAKSNVGAQDQFYLRLDDTEPGLVHWVTEEANNGIKTLKSITALPNGATDWYHLAVSWDTTNGKKIWINGVLEGHDSTATTLMGNGTAGDFTIGAQTGGGSNFYDGKIAQFRIRDKVLTQQDVDLAYSYRYTTPSYFSAKDFDVKGLVQVAGDSDFTRNYNFNDLIVTKNTSYIYRAGGVFTGLGSTDKLKLLAKE